MRKNKEPFSRFSPVGPHITGQELEQELKDGEWEKRERERRKQEGMYKRRKKGKIRKRSEGDQWFGF
jgi:hypothetical protein